MYEQNFDSAILQEAEASKVLVEGKAFEQSQALAQDALNKVNTDLQKAEGLNTEVGGGLGRHL